ncbi:hypothetical protein D9M69_255330 [compost metagenome]
MRPRLPVPACLGQRWPEQALQYPGLPGTGRLARSSGAREHPAAAGRRNHRHAQCGAARRPGLARGGSQRPGLHRPATGHGPGTGAPVREHGATGGAAHRGPGAERGAAAQCAGQPAGGRAGDRPAGPADHEQPGERPDLGRAAPERCRGLRPVSRLVGRQRRARDGERLVGDARGAAGAGVAQRSHRHPDLQGRAQDHPQFGGALLRQQRGDPGRHRGIPGHHRTAPPRPGDAYPHAGGGGQRQRGGDHRQRAARPADRLRQPGLRTHHRLLGRGSAGAKLPLSPGRGARPAEPGQYPPGAGGPGGGRGAAAQLPQGRLGVLERPQGVAGGERPRQGQPLRRHSPRHHRSQALPGGAGAPGQPRQPHRPAQPQPAQRPHQPGHRPGRAQPKPLHAGLHGHRPLQGGQRQPRPQRRRPVADPGRQPPAVAGARDRHRSAPGRRRVHRAVDGNRPAWRAGGLAGAPQAEHRPAGDAGRAGGGGQLQHRLLLLPQRRPRRHHPAAQCRHGDVPGQAPGTQPHLRLHVGDERPGAEAPVHGAGNPCGPAEPGVHGGLPAAVGPAERAPVRFRGAGALEPQWQDGQPG